MHRILERQLKHIFGSVNGRPQGLDDLLKIISDTYEHFDEDRALLDRSLELSSKEFFDNSKNLQKAKVDKEDIEKLVLERTQELKREHENLLTAINSLSVGLVMFDLKDHVIMANHSARRLLGISENINGTSYDEIMRSLSGAIDLQYTLQMLKDKKTGSESKNISLGNKQLVLIFSSVSLPQDPDRILSIAMLIEDILRT